MVELLDYTDTLLESDLQLQTSEFPSGNRDYTFVRTNGEGEAVPISALELLKLDRAAELIEQEKNPAKALNQALSRLLVSSIRTSRVGRHLVVEPWSESVVRGETLPEETRTDFARRLSHEQADQWRAVRSGDCTLEDPLETVFWRAVTDLPYLRRQFDDPKLGAFGKALYFQIVPPGTGRVELDGWEPGAIVETCKKNDFADLKLGFSARELHQLYRKYMAVTVRWTSKLTGQLAHLLIEEMRSDTRPLTPAEQTMVSLKYGAAEHFGKINVGFLFGCGPLFDTFFNEIYRSIGNGRPETEQAQATTDLLQFVFLYRNYLRLRSYARLQEKQEHRDRYWDDIPGRKDGRRINLDDLTELPVDDAATPFDRAVASEAQLLLVEQVLPELEKSRPDQARLLRIFIDCNYDVKVAAEEAELTPRRFNRRLQETILPSAAEWLADLDLVTCSMTDARASHGVQLR